MAGEKILCVDDEANVLASLKRALRGRFDVQTAGGGREGLEIIESSAPFAVVVADMRMREMDGIEFLTKVQNLAPDTVRVMLTGNADMETAVRAVNEGNIFRFLIKPCPAKALIQAISAAAELYRLIIAGRELLEGTLRGSVKVLTDVLSLVNPVAFGRASRVCHYVKHITERLGLENAWEFEVAAMLSQIGCVTLPAETVAKISTGQELADHEKKMLASHPAAGAKLISSIPRLESVAEMIAGQAAPCEGPQCGDEVAIGAQMLKVATEFDKRVTRGIPPSAALAQLRGKPEEFASEIVGALEGVEVRLAGPKVREFRNDISGRSSTALGESKVAEVVGAEEGAGSNV